MLKTLTAFFILSLLIISHQSQAFESVCSPLNQINPSQEPASTTRCRIVGDTFFLEGAITKDIYQELRDFHSDVKHLELNSFGGVIETAYKLAALVRERSLTTNVRKEAKCASVCTLVFQAGIKRSAHPSVKFLYQGESLARQPVLHENEKYFKFMIYYGMDRKFIDYYQKLPDPDRKKDLIISSMKLVDYNIVQDFDLREEFPELEVIPYRI